MGDAVMRHPPILLHPNGFLQYDLSRGKRLHVWHPDMPQAQKVYTPIHDHTFSFESAIIMGELIETVYDWTPLEGHPFGDNPPAPLENEHMLWAAADGILNPTITFGSLSVREVNHYLPGDMYVRGANVFHKTEAGGEAKFAATVMRKLLTKQTPFAYVAIPVGTLPDNTFRRDQYEGDVLWPMVRPALDYLYTLYGRSVSTPGGRFAVLTGREDSVL